MKKALCWLLGAALLAGAAHAQQDITEPGDTIQGIPSREAYPDENWPDGEPPSATIDNDGGTKYLHFRGNDEPVGFRIAPTHSDLVVKGLSFSSANDSPDRDPVAWELSGSNTSIDGPYTLIASGAVADFDQTDAWPRNTRISAPIKFENDQTYEFYQLMITGIRNAPGANSMQVAEVELLGVENGWPPEVDAGTSTVVILPDNTLPLAGTASDYETALENLSIEWSQYSGPATVQFDGTQNQLDATAVFPAQRGLYELVLTVTDEAGNDANDVMQVRVWDPAVDDYTVSHWTFNEGQGQTVDDIAGVNALGTLGAHPDGGEEPNFVAGWIPADGADNFGLEFYDLSYVEVIPDPNEQPWNLNNIQWQIGISAWFNANNWDGNHRIMQKGLSDNQFRLLAERGNFVFDLAGVGRLETKLPPAGTWQHVAATYDGTMMRIYLNGMEIASMEARGAIGTTADPLYIGTKSKNVGSQYPDDYFDGKLDDVRIATYAFSPEEIVTFAAMGQNAPPTVRIAEPDDLVLSVTNEVQLQAAVFDVNGDNLTYQWTVDVANPAVDDPANVTLVPGADVKDPIAVFAAPGTYTFTLTASDGIVAFGEVSDTVDILVENPSCADIIADGLGLAVDFNDDCRIDLADLAIFAQDWMRCVDPMDPNCENPFAQP